MATPKKPVKNATSAKGTGAKKDEKPAESPAKKRVVDDDDDDDFDIPLDDLGRYENFEAYDEDDDY
jgi:cell division septation protein DedD